jgi:hypothetical protein
VGTVAGGVAAAVTVALVTVATPTSELGPAPCFPHPAAHATTARETSIAADIRTFIEISFSIRVT